MDTIMTPQELARRKAQGIVFTPSQERQANVLAAAERLHWPPIGVGQGRSAILIPPNEQGWRDFVRTHGENDGRMRSVTLRLISAMEKPRGSATVRVFEDLADAERARLARLPDSGLTAAGRPARFDKTGGTIGQLKDHLMAAAKALDYPQLTGEFEQFGPGAEKWREAIASLKSANDLGRVFDQLERVEAAS